MDFDDLLTTRWSCCDAIPTCCALPGALRAHPDRRVPGHEHGAERDRAAAGAAHHTVCVVGDTDTTVDLQFRGADFRNIMQFEDAFPDVTTIVLDQNYRSTQTILDAANAVIANNEGRKPKDLWTDQGHGDRIIRYQRRRRGRRGPWVARRITELHEDHRNWREVAVFYRTNAQSRVMEEAMMRFGIPYKVVGGTRFYDRREVKDALAYLRAVINPLDEVSVKRVLNVPKRGIGDTSVAGSTRSRRRRASPSWTPCAVPTKPDCPARPRRSVQVVRGVARLARRTRREGPGPMIQAVLEESGYLAELEAERSVEAAGRLENLGELVGSAREFTRMDEFIEQVSLVADTDDLDDDDRVVLMTLHSAKGLEFPSCSSSGWRRVSSRTSVPSPNRGTGGGAPPRLRRDHPSARATLRHHAWSRNLFGSTQYNPPSRSSTRSLPNWSSNQGNVTGRSSYGRQSERRRDDWGSTAPYRRRGGGDGRRDDWSRRDEDAHKDASSRRHSPQVAATRHNREQSGTGPQVGDDVEHPRSARASSSTSAARARRPRPPSASATSARSTWRSPGPRSRSSDSRAERSRRGAVCVRRGAEVVESGP